MNKFALKPLVASIILGLTAVPSYAAPSLADTMLGDHQAAGTGTSTTLVSGTISSASRSSGTCDATGCRPNASVFGAPDASDLSGGGGIATVSALFKEAVGRTLTLPYKSYPRGSIAGYVYINPTSPTSATVRLRVGSYTYAAQTITNLTTKLRLNPYSDRDLFVSATGFTYKGTGSFSGYCNTGTYEVTTLLSSDHISAGVFTSPSDAQLYGAYEPSCALSCFPAGTRVLMADGSQRAIETIEVGEWLMGADGKPVQVQDVDRPILGDRRMMAMEDGSLYWSEEHAMWTADAAGDQWWWAANPERWRHEASIGHMGGLRDNSTLRGGDGFAFAHLEGWKAQSVDHAQAFGPDTRLYLPRTNGAPIIVNGYVVGAGVNQSAFEYEGFDWNRARHDVLRRELAEAA